MRKNKMSEHKYVVGFVGDKHCVYGPDTRTGISCFVDKLTLSQAKKILAQLRRGRKTIYKLVPVKDAGRLK